MPETKVKIGSSELTIWTSVVSGLEEVRLDGALVSSKRTLKVVSEHRFTVAEGEGAGEYRVRMTAGGNLAVMRNGAIVAEADEPALRYLGAAGLLMVVLLIADALFLGGVWLFARNRLSDFWDGQLPLTSILILLCFVGAIPLAARIKKEIRTFR